MYRGIKNITKYLIKYSYLYNIPIILILGFLKIIKKDSILLSNKKLIKIKFRDLPFYHRLNWNDISVICEVLIEGQYLKIAAFRPGKDDIILDIGCHIGTFSKQCVLEGAKVISIEPIKETYEIAQKNLPSSKVLNIAAGDEDSIKEIHVYKWLTGNLINYYYKDFEKRKVQMMKIDTIIQENNLKKVDLIKIDVDGFEPNILMGAKNTLSKFKPKLIIEYNSYNLEAIKLILKEFRYENIIEKDRVLFCQSDS